MLKNQILERVESLIDDQYAVPAGQELSQELVERKKSFAGSETAKSGRFVTHSVCNTSHSVCNNSVEYLVLFQL